MQLRKPALVTATVLTVFSALSAGIAATSLASALPATAATNYRVSVTCSVPKSQKERQLAPNSCLNYLPDDAQTYTAHVRNRNGNPVAGVLVKWTDSDAKDARFRTAQNPCKTGSNGTCSAELVDTHPQAGEKITVTATVGDGPSANGYLTFRSK